MSLKASYEFLFFGKDDNSFLENYSYDLFQDHGEQSGQIFVNLEVQNNPVDAEEIGAVIFETMQKVFFENVTAEPYDRFEAALKAVNGVLGEFKSQKVSGYIGNLNVIISGIVGDTLLLSQTGDAEAYLIRKRYVSVVSEGLHDDPESEEIFSSIASGQIEEGDLVLFSSTRLLRYISKTDFAKSVHKTSIEDTLGEIKDIVSTEILGRIGMIGVLFSKVTADDIQSIEDGVDTATQSVLEGTASHVVAHKESVTGKFITAVKGYRRKKKSQIYDGRERNSAGGGSMNWLINLAKNKVLGFLMVIILVLVIGIMVTNSNRAAKVEIEKLDEVLTGIQNMISEAETKGGFDKESAKEMLDKAYSDSLTVLNSGYYREKANLYLIQIDDVRDSLDNVQRIEEPELVADLSENRSDVNALGFAVVGDRVFAYEYNALYEVVLDQVQDPLTIDDEETVIAATGFDDRNSVVFLTKSGKLIEYRNGTMSFMDTDDGSFHRGVALADWSNRIYLLDSAGSQIWKYTYKGTLEKFGSAEAYIGDETDLSDAVDVAIDANVFILKSNGDVNKFYAGSKAEFYINNAPFTGFKDPSVIHTTEKLDEVYVLDSAEARVMVFKKDAQSGNLEYSSQYLFDGVGELRDIYVDPDSRELYVLSESKIYKIGL